MTNKWFRIKKNAAVYRGRPLLAVTVSEKEVSGLVDLGGIRGFATAERNFRPDELTPMLDPPKGRPHMVRRKRKAERARQEAYDAANVRYPLPVSGSS